MKDKKISLLSAILLSSTLSSLSFAATNNDEYVWNQDQGSKPSVTFWGLDGNQLIGTGQGLIPLTGVNANNLFYGVVEAAGSFKKSNGYAAGIAAGYRNVINSTYIFGGYLFADYNRSPSGHYFWVANPGIEALGNIWDFRANGYFPTTCKHWIGGETLAEDVGITKFEKAFGHNRYDHFVQWYEEVGPGLDAEVGRKIPLTKTLSLRTFVGGYHYFMDKTDQITGVEGRIVFPVNKHVALEARDSYDNVRKNVFMGGIRVTFGGYDNEEKDKLGITGRLTDPIEHNFGNIASANSVAVGKAYIDEGFEYHIPGSFWYFDNAYNNSSGDGTFEHPFNAIDLRAFQQIINSGVESSNIKLYVDTGTSPYDLSGLPNNRLPLFYGYSIYGRTSNFTLRASDSLRPILNGGIIAFGANNINDIELFSQNNNFDAQGALFIDGAKASHVVNVNINDVNIKVSENKTMAYGIGGLNSQVTINNSQISANSIGQSDQSVGIGLADNSFLYVGNDNYINACINTSGPGEKHAAGIFGIAPVIVYGSNNQIIANAIGSESRAIGIITFGNPIIISGDNNYIAANGAGYDSRAGGIINVGGTTIISGNNNQIIGNAAGLEGKALAIGDISFFDSDSNYIPNANSQIIISGNNNQIIGNSAESNSIGILNTGTLIISGMGNQIAAHSAKHIARHECNAGGIVDFGNTLIISGLFNKINVSSADKAYGILELSPDPHTFSVKNTIFNVASTAASGGFAAGIGLDTLTDASKIIIRNNIFNVTASGINSKAYGIFLPNAITPANNGNIAWNIFNITNCSEPQNAWGVYANSNWDGATAQWIREHNIWLNPTSKSPEQQVYTKGTAIFSDLTGSFWSHTP